ncbi:MAG: transposase [Gemmataceae bacterium]
MTPNTLTGAAAVPQSFASLHYHFVFSTKHREPLLLADLRLRLFDYLGGILKANDGCLVAAGGVEDHVHLLAGLGRETSVADALRLIKANTSKWLHDVNLAPPHFAWQAGYAAFTVSRSQMPVVEAYLANQEEHHRTQSFQDEYRALLLRHDIEFDERYLWD